MSPMIKPIVGRGAFDCGDEGFQCVVMMMVMVMVIVMMVYMILLISPPEVELLTEDEQLFHSFHCASRVVALLARRKFKTFTSVVTGYHTKTTNLLSMN